MYNALPCLLVPSHKKIQDCQHTTSEPVLQIFPAWWEVVNMMREKNCSWEIFNLIL